MNVMMQRVDTPKIAQKFIPYCQHFITEEEINEIIDTLHSSWLTKGPKTSQFENAFSKYIGCKYTVAVSSCTAALHLTLCAYDIKPGDEVITTPMTFCATAEVIEYLQAKPVFVDIDPSNFNLDVNQIESKITPRTKAILPVHYGGIPCDLKQIYEIAERYQLKVIEDAAHAAGTEYGNKKIGSYGYPAAFSFYPTKNITTGEGGAVTTDDYSLAEKIRILSLHGISKDAWKRYDSQGNWYYEVTHLGYKYNFTDLQAALGIQQLKKLDQFNAIREKYAHWYFQELRSISGILMPPWYERYFTELRFNGIKNSWHLFVMMVNERDLKIGRDQFIDELKARHIGTSVHFIPLHLHPYYAQKYGYKKGDYPVADSVYSKIISLPLYPKLTENQMQYIIDMIREVAQQFQK